MTILKNSIKKMPDFLLHIGEKGLLSKIFYSIDAPTTARSPIKANPIQRGSLTRTPPSHPTTRGQRKIIEPKTLPNTSSKIRPTRTLRKHASTRNDYSARLAISFPMRCTTLTTSALPMQNALLPSVIPASVQPFGNVCSRSSSSGTRRR